MENLQNPDDHDREQAEENLTQLSPYRFAPHNYQAAHQQPSCVPSATLYPQLSYSTMYNQWYNQYHQAAANANPWDGQAVPPPTSPEGEALCTPSSSITNLSSTAFPHREQKSFTDSFHSLMPTSFFRKERSPVSIKKENSCEPYSNQNSSELPTGAQNYPSTSEPSNDIIHRQEGHIRKRVPRKRKKIIQAMPTSSGESPTQITTVKIEGKTSQEKEEMRPCLVCNCSVKTNIEQWRHAVSDFTTSSFTQLSDFVAKILKEMKKTMNLEDNKIVCMSCFHLLDHADELQEQLKVF